MKYSEFLKSQGASDEDIKILDTPIAARAFAKMEADRDEAIANATQLDKQYKTYQDQVQSWYTENDAKNKKLQEEVVTTRANEAKARAAILAIQEQGLGDIAEGLGYKVEPPKNNNTAPEFDASKYIARDEFMKIADGIGSNLAALEDMVMEHKQLFPDTPLRVSDLRREAIAANKTVPQYWEEKYRVSAARESSAKAARDAEIAKWKSEGAKEKETELVSRMGNPDTRPLVPSRNPFTPRKDDSLRAKQPWDHADGKLSNDRVLRATQNLVKSNLTN